MNPYSPLSLDSKVGCPSPLPAPSGSRASRGAIMSTQGARLQPAQLARLGMRALSFAHEVANPLNGMSVQAQLLQRAARSDGDAEVAFRVGELVAEIERLKRLIIGFRASVGAAPARLAGRIDLCLALDRALRFVAIDSRVEVRRVIPPSLPALGVGADEVQQVLLNLIKNAVEAMPYGGTLSVVVHCDHQSVHVEISDTGTGFCVAPDARARRSTAKRSGRGLGLPIVQRLVSGLGGTLSFRSAAGGTTVAVSLPVAVGAAPSQGHPRCVG